MVAPHDLPVSAGGDLERSPSQTNAPHAPPGQIRLRTLLLAIAVGAIPLAAIRYGWIEPLTLFPFAFAGGVVGGIVLGSQMLPARSWASLAGSMLGGGLATSAVVAMAVTIHARHALSLLPAIWASAVTFIPAAIVGGIAFFCWEAFWPRTQTFLPRRSKRVKP